MAAVPLSATVSIAPDVLYRELDGELVLLDLRHGVYYGLDAVGTEVWKLFGEARRLQDIAALMAVEYEVDEGQVAADVQALVTALREHGLVEIRD